VSIERVYYCDRRDCEGHVRTAGPRPPATMLSVTEGGRRALHFCSWDCVLHYAADKPPVEVIPFAEAD
jgi:hypothetical protein